MNGDENIGINTLGIPALAYLGDAVFELEARKRMVKDGISSAGNLNKKSLSYVTAQSQSDMMQRIMPLLSEDEIASYKRGKNHKSSYHPKSVSIETYRRASGAEVMFAVLYLEGKTARIEELFNLAFNKDEN